MTLKDLNTPETLLTVQAIPYYSFKEKITTTRKYRGLARVELIDNIIYTEKIKEMI